MSIFWHRPYFSKFRASNNEQIWVVCWQIFVPCYACPLALQMLLCKNHIFMVKGEHIPSGPNTAETNNRGIFWIIFTGTSCSVPRRTMKLSAHSSWVQELQMILALLRKFWQLSLTFLSLGCVTWLHRHLLSTSSNWIQLLWGCPWLSGRFLLLLEGFWLSWGCRSCRRSAEPFRRDFRLSLHYLSPLGAKRSLHSRRSFCPKNVSFILVDLYLLLCIFSPDKS